MEEKRTLLLDMYGVIIKESKGNFIPYTYAHFEPKEHDRLTRAFQDENLFTKAGNGTLSSDEFLSRLGYTNPADTMRDYLEHHLTLDEDFLWFAQKYSKKFNFVLLSNDLTEWSRYLLKLHGLTQYFKKCIVSAEVHLRKPNSRIFRYALEHISCRPEMCIFVDNRVQNLEAAQKMGIRTVLFNRDHAAYAGETVNHFGELERYWQIVTRMAGIRCQRNEWYLLLEMDYVSGVPTSDLRENSEALFCEISEALNRNDCTELTKTALRKIMEKSAGYLYSDLDYKKHKGEDYTLFS